MFWITLSYYPGFATDLTSWETSINQDGDLSQTVRINRFSPEIERTDHLSTRLSAEQMAVLKEHIAATDFAAIDAASKLRSIEDTERCAVKVHQGEAVFEFEAPLLTWASYKEEAEEQLLYDPPWAQEGRLRIGIPEASLASALALWNILDNFSPYGLPLRPNSANLSSGRS